jgi:hypothetical protein
VSNPERREGVMTAITGLTADFNHLCRAIAVLGEATPRALDAVASLGERMSARLLATAIADDGTPAQAVEATQLIITDDCYQNAHPDLDASQVRTRLVLEPILNRGVVPVVTGFLASSAQGVITTLGRGGSDYSAGILGAVLPAVEVWIWSDVDGVMSADPRSVPEARTIPVLTYREIAERLIMGRRCSSQDHPSSDRGRSGCDLQHFQSINGTAGERQNERQQWVIGRHSHPGAAPHHHQQAQRVCRVAARAFGAVSIHYKRPLITQASRAVDLLCRSHLLRRV